jgi:hypothetical protein
MQTATPFLAGRLLLMRRSNLTDVRADGLLHRAPNGTIRGLTKRIATQSLRAKGRKYSP